jgi:hypothetical protein
MDLSPSLDDLFTGSDSVVLLLICETVKNKLHRDLPFFQDLYKESDDLLPSQWAVDPP